MIRKTQELVAVVALGLACLVPPANGQLALIRQGKESVEEPETGDQFGSAIVLGDFNGDGLDDLATGAPIEKNEGSNNQSGHVAINWGTPRGLTWEGAQSLQLLDAGLSMTEQANMGWALAAGDFDGNGCDDLAVGLPTATVGAVNQAGSVLIFYGNPNGLSEAPQILHQGNFSAAVESGDQFGWALAAGKLGNEDFDDLLIGAPGENNEQGAVFLVHGSPLGLSNTTKQIIEPHDLGTPGKGGDRFGRAILVANVMGSAHADLLIGAPFAEDPSGPPNTGRVYLARGTSGGISTSDAMTAEFTPASLDLPQTELARFGASLAAGDLRGNGGPLDLAVGAPGMEIGGRVVVASGGVGSLTWNSPIRATQGPDVANENFGAAIAIGKTNEDSFEDLVVGQPGKSFAGPTQFAAGAVHVFPGKVGGPSQGDGTRLLNSFYDGGGISTQWFGKSLAIGRTSNSPVDSILVGAPLAEGSRGQVYDIAPWRQLDRPSCRSAMAVNCSGEITYALRPFEQLRIASTTKIMTLLLGCEATQRPQNDPLRVGPNESYAIEPWMYQAFPSTSASSMYLFTPLPNNQPPETYTFDELLRILFPPSGNDVSYAIADMMFDDVNSWNGFESTAQGFVDLMNQKASVIGMNDTLFTNPAGVDAGEAASTAYDMWLLAREAMKNPLYAEISGTTDFFVNKILPDGAPGQFQSVLVNASYNWLKTMQGLDPRIIGGKPGGTPGAGRTGVAYARPYESSQNLVFANGFGWGSGLTSRNELAELIGMALDECSLSQEGPSDKVLPPAEPGPWFAGNGSSQGIQLSEFDGTGPDAGSSLDLLSWAPEAPAGASLPLCWNFNGMWEIAPGEEVGLDFSGLTLSSGTLMNATAQVGRGRARARASIDALMSDPASGYLDVTLEEEAALLLPAIQKYSETNQMRFRNDESETIFLAFDFKFAATMGYRNGVAHAAIHPVGQATKLSHTIYELESSGPAFKTSVVLEDRIAGRLFRPTPVIQSHRFIPGASSDGSMQAELMIDELSAERAPLKSFFKGFRVQGSPTLKRGTWTDLGEIKIGDGNSYGTSLRLPAGPKLFLRVVGVEGEEGD